MERFGKECSIRLRVRPTRLAFCEAARLRKMLPTTLVCAVCLGFASHALSAPPTPADQNKVTITMSALLDTTLDSKKRKVGDMIEAKAGAQLDLPDGTVIPREAKIIGVITDAKARSKGDAESSLTIAFQKVILPEGKTLNVKGHLQSVGPNLHPEDPNAGGVDYGSSINRTLEHAGPGQTSYSTTQILTPDSVGAYGIKDLALDGKGVLTSTQKSVKLDHGSQLIIKMEVIPH